MRRALALLALTLPAPALACAPMLDPMMIAAVGAVLYAPLASPASQGLLHALSGRSERAAVWARRFGWLNLTMGLGWLGLIAFGAASLSPLVVVPTAILLISGLYGVLKRPQAAHSTV